MKIHFVGFNWKPEENVPLPELVKVLERQSRQPIPFEKHTRMLFTERDGPYFAGLILTVKDDTQYNLLDQAKLDVEAQEPAKNKRFFDFNAFLVNRSTGAGLYGYYRGSMTIQQFFRFCVMHVENRKVEMRKHAEAGDAEGGPGSPPLGKARAKDKSKGVFDAEVIVRQGSLESLVERLAQVSRFEFRMATTEEREPWFGLVRAAASTVTHVVGFDPQVTRETKKRWRNEVRGSRRR